MDRLTVWVVEPGRAPTEDDIAAARAAGVGEIVSGVSDTLRAFGVDPRARGLVVVDLPSMPPRPPSADERLAAAVAALAGLDTLAAPVLAADVLDTLADLRAALEG